jgi:hypothetical protein
MANKKINQLDTRTGAALTDLSLVGDPTSGTSFKLTIQDISVLMGVPGKYNQPTGTIAQYIRGDGSLATFPTLTGYVPYTGATTNVDLGTHRILAQYATIASSGSGDTFTLNHSSGSGIGLNITKGGSGEGLYINKTSGSGNAATIIGTLNATTFVKSGGTSSQFLKADGSVDSSTYVGGSGTSGQIAYWNGTNGQTGTSFFTTTGSTITINRADDNYANAYLSIGNNNANLRFFLGGDQARISIGNRLNFDANVNMMSNKGIILSNVGIYTSNSRTAMLVAENNDVSGTRTSAVTLGESLANAIQNTTILGAFLNWRTGLTINSQSRLDGQSTNLGFIGSYFGQTITAPANNSFLAGVVIRPTFTNGAFTGITNIALGIENSIGYSIYQLGSAANYLAANLLLGSSVDGGQRLQVYGNTFIKGSGTDGSTFPLLIQNNNSVTSFSVNGTGTTIVTAPTNTEDNNLLFNIVRPNAGKIVTIRDRASIEIGNNNFIYPTTGDANATISRSTSGLFIGQTDGSTTTEGVWNLSLGRPNNINNNALVAVDGGLVQVIGQFNPTSGSAVFTSFKIRPTINQTGGANGITRGLFIEPSLAAAANWRSIEWSNNSGWGLYGAGTAANYFGGSLGIGSTSLSVVNFRNQKTISGGVTSYANLTDGIVQQAVTSNAFYYATEVATVNIAFTLPNLYHYRSAQGTFGASSTVTNQFGFYVDSSLISATNDYGFYGGIPNGTNRWNLYMNGDADNYLRGKLLINTTTISTFNLDVNGTARVSGDLTLATNAAKINGSTSGNILVISNPAGTRSVVINQNGGILLDREYVSAPYFLTGSTQYRDLSMTSLGSSGLVLYDGGTGDMALKSGQNRNLILDAGQGIGGNRAVVLTSTYPVVGTSYPAKLVIESTTQGFLPSRMTTTQKTSIASPVAGLIVYDTTLNKLCVHNGTTWETITSV